MNKNGCFATKYLLLSHHLTAFFSRTTWVSWHQKGRTILDLMKPNGGWQWHQLDHMQTICTSLQTDNHASTSSLKFCTGRMLFLTPKQQCER